MKPTTKILIGAPVHGDEAHFLRTLHADVAGCGALILANFVVDQQQIDFVVVLPSFAALLELKNFARPIYGERNGDWKYLDATGRCVRYEGGNPWQQTLNQKFALSDEMRDRQRNDPSLPAPGGKGFYTGFDAFVCIYPSIHPDSRVTPGDHKVYVKSYADVLAAIRAGRRAATWSVADWERFAERHLHLTAATLQEATDPKIRDASQALLGFRERVRTILAVGLPPMLGGDAAEYGSALVEHLCEPRNYLVTGPTGTAKTFHLHHLAVRLAAQDNELPIVIEAGQYRGGEFFKLLRRSIAPFYRGDANELLDAARICGQKIVLLMDALNECGEAHLPALLRGAQAFALRYNARIVVTSQRNVELPADLKGETVALAWPNKEQKRAIYAYHAGIPATPDLDRFCAGFTNAYDLTVAARSHAAEPPSSRVELYDRYIRRALPEHTTVASAVLRNIAGKMGTSVSFVLSRDKFETVAEGFLTKNQASLDVLDALAQSRLVRFSSDFFTFEHELLFRYFKAEDLRRRFDSVEELATELRRPRNQELIEFVLPRFTDKRDIRAILQSVSDPELLLFVAAGGCGKRAQDIILEECEKLLREALQSLMTLEVRLETMRTDDGRRRLVNIEIDGTKTWSAHDAMLCDVIAQCIDLPGIQNAVLQLIDSTEATLKRRVYQAAEHERFRPEAVWAEAVRLYGGVVQYSTMRLPATAILGDLRSASMKFVRRSRTLPIRRALFERSAGGSHFALLALLGDTVGAGIAELADENIALVEQGWNSGIYIIRTEALQFVESMRSAVAKSPKTFAQIQNLLQSFSSENLLESTALVEALSIYDALESGVSADGALEEMRALLGPGALDDPGVIELAKLGQQTPSEVLSGFAYSALSKIFEDVFDGAYYEAYQALTPSEKCEILCLAASGRDNGFNLTWMIIELLHLNDERALPVFRKVASNLDGGETFPQERVAAFVLGIEGCARWLELPPTFDVPDTPANVAWRIAGEMLFWQHRFRETAQQRIMNLWREVEGDVLLSFGDVLYQLAHALSFGDRDTSIDLVTSWPNQARRVAEACLSHNDALPSLFISRRGDVTEFLIKTLEQVGTGASIPTLQRLTDDTRFGKHAIHAIEQIQFREAARSTTA